MLNPKNKSCWKVTVLIIPQYLLINTRQETELFISVSVYYMFQYFSVYHFLTLIWLLLRIWIMFIENLFCLIVPRFLFYNLSLTHVKNWHSIRKNPTSYFSNLTNKPISPRESIKHHDTSRSRRTQIILSVIDINHTSILWPSFSCWLKRPLFWI